jgi:MFS family permease
MSGGAEQQIDEAGGLTDGQRRASLAALFASNFSFGLAFGGFAPLIALLLESRGVDSVIIGLNTSMSPLGVICMASLVPYCIKRLGSANAFFIGVGISVTAMALMPIFESLSAWFILRFVIGAGLAVPWIVSETWLNTVTLDKTRGRTMAVYAAILAGGFAAGPLILTVVGTEGPAPFYWCTAVFAVAILPMITIRHLAPRIDFPEHSGIWAMTLAAPTIIGAAIVAGVLDTSIFSFLPIYGLRLGMTEENAVFFLSLFLIGGLTLQLPIGWIADHVNRRTVLVCCGAVAAVAPLLMPLVIDQSLLLGSMLVIWGAAGWSMYAVGLAMLGERFKGGQLASANSAFIMGFEGSNIAGPVMAGFAIGIWEPHGLMVFMAIVAALFVLLAVGRGIIRR